MPSFVPAREPIPITVRLRNRGAEAIPVSSAGGRFLFHLRVTTPLGKEVRRTDLGKRLMPTDQTRRPRPSELPPDSEATQSLLLNDLFMLNEPGTYRLSVYCNPGQHDDDGTTRPLAIADLPFYVLRTSHRNDP